MEQSVDGLQLPPRGVRHGNQAAAPGRSASPCSENGSSGSKKVNSMEIQLDGAIAVSITAAAPEGDIADTSDSDAVTRNVCTIGGSITWSITFTLVNNCRALLGIATAGRSMTKLRIL